MLLWAFGAFVNGMRQLHLSSIKTRVEFPGIPAREFPGIPVKINSREVFWVPGNSREFSIVIKGWFHQNITKISNFFKIFFSFKWTSINKNLHSEAQKDNNSSKIKTFTWKWLVFVHFYSNFGIPGNSREFFSDFPGIPVPGNNFSPGILAALLWIFDSTFQCCIVWNYLNCHWAFNQ